jgi:predicted nucleic acid-binding protein
MGLSTALTDSTSRLIADSSTIINLISTGWAEPILIALPNKMMVVDVVPAELESGRAQGRSACDVLRQLVVSGVVEIVSIEDAASQCFEELVVGPAAETLDDGEAATVAVALARGDTALIDERKAIRICRERFPQLKVACTIDVLLHQAVHATLGPTNLADAVFKALQVGRMRVLPQHESWVLDLIGDQRAALCECLPRRMRTQRTSSPPS